MANNQSNDDKLRDLIRKHEGSRDKVYTDSEGHPTVGVGFNLDRPGARRDLKDVGAHYDKVRSGTESLTREQMDRLLGTDINRARDSARKLIDNFDELPVDRQHAVVDMVFNMGPGSFSKFKETIDAIRNQEWSRAARAMQGSTWAGQVRKRRVDDDVKLMKGTYYQDRGGAAGEGRTPEKTTVPATKDKNKDKGKGRRKGTAVDGGHTGKRG